MKTFTLPKYDLNRHLVVTRGLAIGLLIIAGLGLLSNPTSITAPQLEKSTSSNLKAIEVMAVQMPAANKSTPNNTANRGDTARKKTERIAAAVATKKPTTAQQGENPDGQRLPGLDLIVDSSTLAKLLVRGDIELLVQTANAVWLVKPDSRNGLQKPYLKRYTLTDAARLSSRHIPLAANNDWDLNLKSVNQKLGIQANGTSALSYQLRLSSVLDSRIAKLQHQQARADHKARGEHQLSKIVTRVQLVLAHNQLQLRAKGSTVRF